MSVRIQVIYSDLSPFKFGVWIHVQVETSEIYII